MNKNNFHAQSIEEVLKKLNVTVNGLSIEEAKKRLAKFGQNKLAEDKKLSAFKLLLDQFKNPLIYILFFALVISFSTRHYTDGWIIFAVIAISTIVGFLQEFKANSALSKLKQLVKYKAKVIRDGKEVVLDQVEIVPGDIIE
ncbi:hypothetical protein KKC44_06895, partial [Patescibacteria group bacterium]|nr:hypothetical protein [Patescibacteria group bacterium]